MSFHRPCGLCHVNAPEKCNVDSQLFGAPSGPSHAWPTVSRTFHVLDPARFMGNKLTIPCLQSIQLEAASINDSRAE